MRLQSPLAWFRRLLRSRRYYCCLGCGFEFLKATAKLSGGAGYEYGYHVHCPRCGEIVVAYLFWWRRD